MWWEEIVAQQQTREAAGTRERSGVHSREAAGTRERRRVLERDGGPVGTRERQERQQALEREVRSGSRHLRGSGHSRQMTGTRER